MTRPKCLDAEHFVDYRGMIEDTSPHWLDQCASARRSQTVCAALTVNRLSIVLTALPTPRQIARSG
jgi:hypothetical protein